MNISYLKRLGNPDIAYAYSTGNRPLVMFCGGYRSDMDGTKARFLEEQCQKAGRAFVRFDYSGHGLSAGMFEDGTIGSWFEDTLGVFDYIGADEVVVVGSSMGGWMALLLAEARPEKLKGLIGIAPAPDFTAKTYEALSEKEKDALAAKGYLTAPSDYGEPYYYSKALFNEGKKHLLLNEKRRAPCPFRFLQGDADTVVTPDYARKVADNYEGDVNLRMLKGGDHSLSRPEDLEILWACVDTLCKA